MLTEIELRNYLKAFVREHEPVLRALLDEVQYSYLEEAEQGLLDQELCLLSGPAHPMLPEGLVFEAFFRDRGFRSGELFVRIIVPPKEAGLIPEYVSNWTILFDERGEELVPGWAYGNGRFSRDPRLLVWAFEQVGEGLVRKLEELRAQREQIRSQPSYQEALERIWSRIVLLSEEERWGS